MCCVKIQQGFIYFKPCTCPFHLIPPAHVLEEAVNRGLPDTFPVQVLITPLLYPLSYLFLRPDKSLASQSFLSRQVVPCLGSSLLPCPQPFTSPLYPFRGGETRTTCNIQDRQTSHLYSGIIISSLSFFVPFLVISNTHFFTVSEQWADVFTELPIITPRSQS